MTREEVAEIAEEAANRAVRKMMLSLGADPADPIEIQKDFAHLRAWRTSTEAIKRQGLMTTVGVVVVAFLGMLALMFKPPGWPT